MKVATTVHNVREIIRLYRQAHKTIGFVPTMGALHAGHLQLVREAQNEHDCVICSIYVNPTQFNNTIDLEKYPRDIDSDRTMLEQVGCSLLFAPTDTEMYPLPTRLTIGFGLLEETMEGYYRKNHFNGVAIVVSKLFHIIQPDVAYFGQKDLQQFTIIQQLVNDLHFPVQLRCIPTVREANGLAMSSRNKRLSNEQKHIASQLYQWLNRAAVFLKQTRSIEKTIQYINDDISHYPAIRVEYFQFVELHTLQPITDLAGHSHLAICIAAYVGDVRLIDNMIVDM